MMIDDGGRKIVCFSKSFLRNQSKCRFRESTLFSSLYSKILFTLNLLYGGGGGRRIER